MAFYLAVPPRRPLSYVSLNHAFAGAAGGNMMKVDDDDGLNAGRLAKEGDAAGTKTVSLLVTIGDAQVIWGEAVAKVL